MSCQEVYDGGTGGKSPSGALPSGLPSPGTRKTSARAGKCCKTQCVCVFFFLLLLRFGRRWETSRRGSPQRPAGPRQGRPPRSPRSPAAQTQSFGHFRRLRCLPAGPKPRGRQCTGARTRSRVLTPLTRVLPPARSRVPPCHRTQLDVAHPVQEAQPRLSRGQRCQIKEAKPCIHSAETGGGRGAPSSCPAGCSFAETTGSHPDLLYRARRLQGSETTTRSGPTYKQVYTFKSNEAVHIAQILNVVSCCGARRGEVQTHGTSRHRTSRHTTERHATSRHVMSHHAASMSCHLPVSCSASRLSRGVVSWSVASGYLIVMSYIMSCHFLSRRDEFRFECPTQDLRLLIADVLILPLT